MCGAFVQPRSGFRLLRKGADFLSWKNEGRRAEGGSLWFCQHHLQRGEVQRLLATLYRRVPRNSKRMIGRSYAPLARATSGSTTNSSKSVR